MTKMHEGVAALLEETAADIQHEINAVRASWGDEQGRLYAEAVIGATGLQGTEARVCADIASRQALGIQKYGTTVEANPLSLRQWLEHAYQETLDKAVYLRRAMEEIDAADASGITMVDALEALKKIRKEGDAYGIKGWAGSAWGVRMTDLHTAAWLAVSMLERTRHATDEQRIEAANQLRAALASPAPTAAPVPAQEAAIVVTIDDDDAVQDWSESRLPPGTHKLYAAPQPAPVDAARTQGIAEGRRLAREERLAAAPSPAAGDGERPYVRADLPPLPEWVLRDDLGGMAPSEIRVAMRVYARAAITAHEAAIEAARSQSQEQDEADAAKYRHWRDNAEALCAVLRYESPSWIDAYLAGELVKRDAAKAGEVRS